MSRHGESNECRIYVGNLPPDIRTKDIEDLFSKYGKIAFVDLKNRVGPPFAFVEFGSTRDTDDAIKHRDGYDYDGYRIRVERPRGQARNGGGGGGGYSAPYSRPPRGGGFMNGRGGPPRGGIGTRTGHKLFVTGLPSSGSWQDLKDHMREAGDVVFTDVFKDGTGVVEYLRYDDMKYALRKLDDTKFRSHEGDTTYIRVKEHGSSSGGGGSSGGRDRERRASRGRRRSRSVSGPPRRTRDSPSYSPLRRSRSKSRSRSRSARRSASGSRSGSGSPEKIVKSESKSRSRSRSKSK